MREIQRVNEAVEFLKSTYPDFESDLAIIIGSNSIEYNPIHIIDYQDIPNFPTVTNRGAAGTLILATIEGKNCYIMNGRVHGYNGYSPLEVIRPIRIFKGLGVKTLLITNTSRAVNLDFDAGELMLITDHINFSGDNPLRGEDSLDFGPQFPNMTNAYDPELQELIRDTALTIEIPLNEGVFMKFNGPSFETPSEVRIARAVGADAVGMSTVYECIAAIQCGMKVAGISSITHMAAGVGENETMIETILHDCNIQLSLLISSVINKL